LREHGEAHHTRVLDVCDETAWETLAAGIVAEVGVPDIVVNNAGIGFIGSFMETDTAAWRKTLDVNLLGVVYGSKVFLTAMLARGSGCIVNVASAASRVPLPNMAAYAASKSAVEGLSDVLALDLADTPLRVVCVYPGVINTAIVTHGNRMLRGITDRQAQRLQAHYAARGAHPREVAKDVLRALVAGRVSVFTGPGAKLADRLARLLPKRLLRKATLQSARKMGYL
jgi:short-subunit dehydrogenase